MMNMAAMLRAACVTLTLLLSTPKAGSHSPQQSFFSDLKRCADEECSMLMCRGKAVQDFTGPDCRFLKIKAGETIYVYYKLSGRRNNLWAGSMGSQFGYFPKDLIDVNLVYTTDEIEMPVEETDFVCFDGESEIFDYVDLDQLGGGGWVSKIKMESHTNTNDASISKSQEEDEGSGPKALQKDTESGFERTHKVPEADRALQKLQPESSLPSNSGVGMEDRDSIEDIKRNSGEILPYEDEAFEEKSIWQGETATSLKEHWVGGDEARDSGPSDLKSSNLTMDSGGLQEGSWGEAEGQSEGSKDIAQGQDKQWDSTERVTLETEKLDSLPHLETSLGSTIDAVVTDDEVTRKVTALDEKPEFHVDDVELKEVPLVESTEKVPLLEYSGDQVQPQFLLEDMTQEGDVDGEQVGKSTVSDTGRTSHSPILTVITVDSEKSKPESEGKMDVTVEETLDKPHGMMEELLGNVDGSIKESMGNLHEATEPLRKMDGVTTERLGKVDGTVEETLGNNNRVTEKVQYKTKDELPRGVSRDKSGQTGSILTTLGETVYAIVSGDESTAKIMDLSSSDSNEIPEQIQESTSKDSEEARGTLLLSMLKKENRLDVVRSVETDIGGRSGPKREDSKDTVTRILASDNLEMPPKEPSVVGKIIDPMAESQGPELFKDIEIKTKVLGLIEEIEEEKVGGEEGLEKEEEQVGKFKRQTLKEPNGETLTETGSSGKVGQTESDTKVDNSSDLRFFENRLDEDGDATSQDRTRGDSGRGQLPAQELSLEESRGMGEATMGRAKVGMSSEESLRQEAAGLLERREGAMNEPADEGKKIGRPLESILELEVDTIQEEMDEEQFNLPEEEAFDEEPYFVDSEEHEELLEDENAVDARMSEKDHSGGAAAAAAADDDAQEMGAASWVEDVDLPNSTELEDDESAFKVVPTVSTHEVKSQGELSGTKGEKQLKHLDLQQPEGLSGENLDHRLERTSEVGGKVTGHRGQGKSQLNEEDILGDDRRNLQGKDPLKDPLKPAKVEGKEAFEDMVYGSKDIGLEDEDKIIADPEFNESVEQLTFLKPYFDEDHLKRLYDYIGLQHLLELKTMLLDLEEELRVTKHSSTGGDIEKALDNVLEASESQILDEIENMLGKRAQMEGLHTEEEEETMLLDDFQELLHQIREKYSTSRESTLLAPAVNTPQEDKQLSSNESRQTSKPGEGEKEQSLSQRTQGEEEAEATNVMGDEAQPIEEEDDDEEVEEGEDEKIAFPHSANLTKSGVQVEELQDEVKGELSSSNLTASFAREEAMGEKGKEVVEGIPSATDRRQGEELADKSLGIKYSPSLTESVAQYEREKEHTGETSRVQQPPNFTQSAQHRIEKEEAEQVEGDETDQDPRSTDFSRNHSENQEDSPSVNSTEGDVHMLGKWDQGNGTERKVGSFETEGYIRPTEKKMSPITIENVGISSREGIEEEAVRREKQQQEAKSTTPVKDSDEMGRQVEELGTRDPLSTLTDSRQLPWIIGLLDAIILVIKENGWPLLQPVAESGDEVLYQMQRLLLEKSNSESVQ